MSTQPTVDPVTAVALGHVLTHAAEVGLALPVSAHLGGSAGVRIYVDSLSDLAEWSLYMEVPIVTEPLTATTDHHTVDGEFLELPVRVSATLTYAPLSLVDSGAQR